MSRRIPDLVLERYRLNELPDRSMRAVAHQLAADPDARQRLEALDASDQEIRQQYRGSIVVRDVPAVPRRWVLRAAVATGLTLLAIAIALPRNPRVQPDENRVKGTTGGHPTLVVYRRTPNGSERLADGDMARPGDLLRVGYAAAGRAFGMILSIDGRGAVTLHLPPDPRNDGRAVRLAEGEQGKPTLLDAAYELDDAPRTERFFFVTASEPFPVGPVMEAARRAAQAGGPPVSLALAPGLEQHTFAIQKEGRK